MSDVQDSDDTQQKGDNEQDTQPANHVQMPQPMTLLAVTFKEAALDSPTFRASMNHLNDQFDALDRWIDGFCKATLRVSQEMDTLQDIVNYMISRFVPDFVTQGLIDHDYTMLVMRRYAEANRYYWANVISRMKSQSTKCLEALSEFQRADLRSFKDCRRNFEAAQSRYDTVLSRYAATSKSKEPSSLREDAFQVSEAKKAYTKACFDLCCIVATTQRNLDKVLVDTLAESWILKKSLLSDPVYQRLGVEMHRIKSWSKVMSQSLKPIEAEMLKARKEMEDQVLAKSVPSRDLSDYTPQNSTVSHFVPDNNKKSSAEKHGWVFVKTSVKPARQVWVRRWAFVKDGMFGWLVLSSSRTYVQESDKIGVLLCNVSPEPNEDRRFCFEVRTKDTFLIMQAENLADLKSWLQVFEVSKRTVIQQDNGTSSDMSYAFQQVHPLIPEFAATPQSTVDQELTHSDGEHLLQSNSATDIQTLITSGKNVLMEGTFSAVGPFGTALAPSPLINVPMPTGMVKEAIAASSIVSPTAVPNAITSNYWGSVNWALYLKSTQLAPRKDGGGENGPNPNKIVPMVEGGYPDSYPADLKAQDAQMRAIFQTLVDNDPMDRVVMVFRAMVSPNSRQELPGRVFMTPKNMYLYCNCFGFSAVVKRSMKDVVSIEGHASTSWDTLYIVDGKGTSALCRVFLDSGRTIQKRLQYLADVYGHDVSLEEIIKRLRSMGQTPPDESEEDQVKSTLQKFLTYRPPKEKESKPTEKTMQVDLTTTMDQLVIEKNFDVSPKALFHIMFGEHSDVFNYEDSSLYKRKRLDITPWRYNRAHLEREIRFKLQSSGVLVGDQSQSASIVQRIEKMEDNYGYIVYDRRPPWELPHGDIFYIASRFVVTADQNNKNKCHLAVYASIEWIKCGKLVRSVVERIVYNHFGLECKQIVKRISESRDKLGKRGMAVTAIRMFGKLGTSGANKDDQDKGEGVEDDDVTKPFSVSHYSLGTRIYELTVGWIISTVSTICIITQRVVSSGYHAITAHKLLVGALICSALFNLFLSGKATISYWSEKHAVDILHRTNVLPSPHDTVMRRSVYMSDIDELIEQGGTLAAEPSGGCYRKFASLAYSPTMDLDLVVGGGAKSSNAADKQISRRIHNLRNELGVRRNRLIVALRSLNRLEQESLLVEWQRWLLSELRFCELAHEQRENDKQIDQYCHSCMREWNHTLA